MQTKLCICFCGTDSHIMFHIFTCRYTCFILVLSLYGSLGHISHYLHVITNVATCKRGGSPDEYEEEYGLFLYNAM